MAYIEITHKADILTILFTQYEGRKSRPELSQKGAEEMVQKVHDSVKKISSYVGTRLGLDPVDYYDEGYDHYTVAGASIKKGERKARNTSWEKTSIPKCWNRELMVSFGEVKQTTKPIVDAIQAMGYTLTDAHIKDIKNLLSTNGYAYVNIDVTTSYNNYNFRCNTTTTINVSDYSNE